MFAFSVNILREVWLGTLRPSLLHIYLYLSHMYGLFWKQLTMWSFCLSKHMQGKVYICKNRSKNDSNFQTLLHDESSLKQDRLSSLHCRKRAIKNDEPNQSQSVEDLSGLSEPIVRFGPFLISPNRLNVSRENPLASLEFFEFNNISAKGPDSNKFKSASCYSIQEGENKRLCTADERDQNIEKDNFLRTEMLYNSPNDAQNAKHSDKSLSFSFGKQNICKRSSSGFCKDRHYILNDDDLDNSNDESKTLSSSAFCEAESKYHQFFLKDGGEIDNLDEQSVPLSSSDFFKNESKDHYFLQDGGDKDNSDDDGDMDNSDGESETLSDDKSDTWSSTEMSDFENEEFSSSDQENGNDAIIDQTEDKQVNESGLVFNRKFFKSCQDILSKPENKDNDPDTTAQDKKSESLNNSAIGTKPNIQSAEDAVKENPVMGSFISGIPVHIKRFQYLQANAIKRSTMTMKMDKISEEKLSE